METIKSKKDFPSNLVLIIVVQVICTLGIIGYMFFSGRLIKTSKDDSTSIEAKLNYAENLYTQELYKQATVEFQSVLDLQKLPDDRIAALAFKIGEIYMEKLRQYDDALAYFLKAEQFDKSRKLSKEIDENKVACLEKMKRSTDAQRILEKDTLLNPKEAEEPDASKVVAEVGSKKITLHDFENEINNLPDKLKNQALTRKGKLQFLQNMVATELIYNAAKRQGYGRNPKIIQSINNFEKNLLVRAYIGQELGNKINIAPSDLELFYQAHKENYKGKKFNDVKEQVAKDLQNQKFQEAIGTLFDRLSKAETVTLHPENIAK